MPIGGSAYYEKLKNKTGPTSTPAVAPTRVQTRPPVPVKAQSVAPVQTISVASATVINKSKRFTKTVRPFGRTVRSGVRASDAHRQLSDSFADPSALSEVIAQILDLTQRVHSVAGQAEAAILRAEAAVLKAEIAVGKAEAAGLRAETSSAKCDNAVSLTEAALFKSQSSAKLADMFAGKAGLAAGKSELASVGRNASSVKLEAATITSAVGENSADASTGTGLDYRTQKIDSPVSQVAVMSMKLRTGMRQIEEPNESEQTVDRPRSYASSPTFNVPVCRDNLASGLISLDSDTALPRVAPFIMDVVSYDSRLRDEANSDESGVDSRSKLSRSSVSSAA